MSRPSTTNLYPPSTAHTTYPGSNQLNSNSRTLTLWIHDPEAPGALSRFDSVLNYELFPPGVAKPGDVAEVRLIPQTTTSAGGNMSSEGYSSGGNGHVSDNGSGAGDRRTSLRKGSYAGSVAGDDDRSKSGTRQKEDEEGRFLFVIRELEESQRKLNVQISLANHVAALFGFPSRATVRVTIVDKPLHEASHVEIFFRDQHITRSDTWRLTTSLLSNTCPYKQQKLLFIGSIRATVGNIWVRGEKVRSAYFSPRTVPIFRSESARYVIFIQMSREMWQFDTYDGDGDADGDAAEENADSLTGGTGGVGGEIMFNKLINGFLPELFKRWRRIDAHHLVSIVLFTRIVYEHGEPVGIVCPENKHDGEEFLGTPGGIELGEGRRYRDFFRVVISNIGNAEWTVILHQLKREFAIFLRDCMVQSVPEDDGPEYAMMDLTPPASSAASMVSRPGTPSMLPVDKFRPLATPHHSPRLPPTGRPPRPPKTIIAGRPSAAIHGNILEAINLATIQYSKTYIDVDLVRTGVSIVMITPGTGIFEVDYEMLKATTEGLIANGMGIDLVCLSRAPLHMVPLFRYRNPASSRDEENQLSRPGVSPPKHSGHQLQPGEWVYAMPHWIDISFWSSASEKKTRRSRGPGSGKVEKRKDPKLQKKKAKQVFRARCKIYELQMMGIVENETSCITVPFLHDNPLWKPFPEDGPSKEVTSKDAEKKRRDQWKEEHFGWMDEYDDLSFRPLQYFKEAIARAEEKKVGIEEQEKKILKTLDEEDPLVLGTSFRGDDSRPASARHGGFFDRKMKERCPELTSPTETTETQLQHLTSTPSSAEPNTLSSAAGALLTRPAARLRQISFGFKAWGGATKSAAKATTTDVTGLGTMVTRGFDTSEHSLASPKSTGPLSPRSNRDARLEDVPEKPSMTWGTRPISIHGSNHHATSSLEVSKEARDRRRSLVGSPHNQHTLDYHTQRGMRDSALSRPAGPRNDLVANAEKNANLPATVSPTSAIAPWVQVLNPSNPKKNTHTFINQYRRWHHVFPKPVKISSVKWKSLCTPALLPLTTEHFPSAEQLATEYQESPYVISQNSDYELGETSGDREALVRAMIALRLEQGFQIVVGNRVMEATQGRGGQTGIYDLNYMCKPGSSCFMSRGSQIHQLICDEEYNVEAKRYIRKPATAIMSNKPSESDEYTSYIKTQLKPTYRPVKATFSQPSGDYNWNYADQYIGGYEDELTDQLKFCRARFVLIPVDPPASAKRGQAPGAELNDEEIRLEGIRRLTMIFQRNRYVPPEERHYERYGGRQRAKEKNPLQILYKTVDPSVAVAQELETLSQMDGDGHMRRSQLLTTEMFESKNLDLNAIAQELQGPRGVPMQTRRWHIRLHTNCFIGEEMVTWIVENFKDVNTRPEAENVGRTLLQQGLFQHVDKRHEFRDGNYFYRIAEQYATPQRPSSKGGWLGTFNKSVPPTPTTDTASFPPQRSRSRSSSMLTDDSVSTEGAGGKTPTASTHPKKKAEVELSKSMKYDVDPSHKSYRPEVITLHYDRLHNPDNCYHIRIDWMNTTGKLIEDCLTSWARTVDRYGLKLVEAPIDEVSRISQTNLFRAPIVLRPALAPPPPPSPVSTVSLSENMELSTILSPLSTFPPPTSLQPPPPPDPWMFHKLILKKFNFVLDTEAASNFPEDVKVRYSWGSLNYQWSQYIHRSGVLFAQISDVGDFHLMANRAYTLRVTSPPQRLGTASSAASAVDVSSPVSPSVVPLPTPEGIKEEMEAFLGDAEALRRFYEEVLRGRAGARHSQSGLVGGRWDSPIIAPVGVVRMGSPTVGASEVHAFGGREGKALSLRSGETGSGETGSGEEEGFMLAK
ncbi:hypothetical protein FN846DRAFT_1025469 [Sphaerosporella brunnea]|uniref:Vacuolar membrane-associated protein IML1 n=1 Tax=Sphaerosporella brunnea TaxID=1250544 RepID=A0A5J5EDW8_9PEZI|nr:hypothetical protein FN846DRAFT_1025469 [Sphaerosporella brunnea]